MQTKWDSVHANHRQWIWQVGGWLHAASWTVLLPCAVVWCSGGLLFPVKWILYHNLSQFCAWHSIPINVIQCHSINVKLSWFLQCTLFDMSDQGWEPFFGHALGPLFAAFLAASAAPAPGCQSLVVRLLRHEALVALGEFSFEAGTAVHSYAPCKNRCYFCVLSAPLSIITCPASLSFLDCQSPWLTQI